VARYTNLDGTTPDKGLSAILKWQVLDRIAGRRPRQEPFVMPRRENDGEGLAETSPHLTWVGHATFLLRLGGQLVATDPIWSNTIQGAVRRLVPPGVRLEAAPKPDVVTISHAHFDHLDIPTLEKLGPEVLYVVPKDNGEILRRAGLGRIVELEWWQSHKVGDLAVTLVPAQHWSMRFPWDRNTRLWGGFIYESAEGTAYHAGDTAFSEDVFAAIAERFPKIDWAMFPIGAYEPKWFMRGQHIDPVDAVRAWETLRARIFVAMHWGTFRLTDEPLGEPPELLRSTWRERGHATDRLWIPEIGETRRL
jgi:L-ascorbate metabolism protein UlaG (beta-lactamase superfamily)